MAGIASCRSVQRGESRKCLWPTLGELRLRPLLNESEQLNEQFVRRHEIAARDVDDCQHRQTLALLEVRRLRRFTDAFADLVEPSQLSGDVNQVECGRCQVSADLNS